MESDRMRVVTVPQKVLDRAAEGPIQGNCLEFPVTVSWPELQLTEEQVIANAMARVGGHPEPFLDHSIFVVRVPWYTKSLEKMAPSHRMETAK